MPHLAVIQLMRVIKWSRSDSYGSCVNENVLGDKGFYSTAEKEINSMCKLTKFVILDYFEIFYSEKPNIDGW